MNDVVTYSGAVVPHVDEPAAMSAGHAPPAPLQGNVTFNVEDQPIVAAFQSAMSWAPKSFINAALKWYTTFVSKDLATQEAAHKGDMKECTNALRAEWGSSYALNMRAAMEYFNGLPAGVKDALETAELEDGTFLLQSQVGIRWLFELSRRPVQVASHAGGSSVEAEIAAIKELMAKPGSAYHKGPRAEGIQARYRQLLDMRGGQ